MKGQLEAGLPIVSGLAKRSLTPHPKLTPPNRKLQTLNPKSQTAIPEPDLWRCCNKIGVTKFGKDLRERDKVMEHQTPFE